jgi:cbb3-type cytochrome oxidase subunit 1
VVADSKGGLITVAVLAIWLGLATLNYPAAPPLLLWLSLVASFLLFVSVWGGLQKRPAS